MKPPHIELKYKNYRGETAIREIRPIRVYYDSIGCKFHPQPGWRLECFDIERQAPRTYALADCDFNMTGSLEAAWEAVQMCHKEVFGHPAPDKPSDQTFWEHDKGRRYAWILDECDELAASPNITECADAYLDIIIFALGGLVELGVKPSKLFDRVIKSQIDKLQPDGTVMRREDGKVIKPEGWIAPDTDIAEMIKEQMK